MGGGAVGGVAIEVVPNKHQEMFEVHGSGFRVPICFS